MTSGDQQQTLTLTHGEWLTLRTAVLCFCCDERRNGNSESADHFMTAYRALKDAMGDNR